MICLNAVTAGTEVVKGEPRRWGRKVQIIDGTLALNKCCGEEAPLEGSERRNAQSSQRDSALLQRECPGGGV